MCFSAEVSFGASAVISTIGIISFKKSANLPQKVLSWVPIVFGIQQFTEGMLWLSLTHPELAYWNRAATYGFLVFAGVVWPIFLPLAVLLLEETKSSKRMMGLFLTLGGIVASIICYTILFNKIDAGISCYHIRYDLEYPPHLKHAGVFYIIATVIPPIISRVKMLRVLGVAILISYVVTRVFFEYYLLSVWCFFASIISIIILLAIIRLNQRVKTSTGNLGV